MKSSTITRLFSTAAVLGALAAPAVADEHEGIALPGASAEITLDYVTNYFFRGIEQGLSDEGLVFQPGASFTIPVEDDITATIGTSNSYHTETAVGSDGNWFESDLYGSIDATFGDFSGSVGFTLYSYPNAATTSVTELNVGISFDDSEYLGDFAFNPYALLAIEVNNTNALNTSGDEATYLEIGGAFSLDGLTEGTFAEVWTWELPVVVGLSIHDYYNDTTGNDTFFGFASIGLAGEVPLSEYIGTDEYFGAWDLNVGITMLILNGDLINGAAANSITDNSSDFQFIGSVGISRAW